ARIARDRPARSWRWGLHPSRGDYAERDIWSNDLRTLWRDGKTEVRAVCSIFTSPRWGEVGAKRRVRGLRRRMDRNPSPGLHLVMQSDPSRWERWTSNAAALESPHDHPS